MRIAVIGGGLIGLCAAYHLDKRGAEVVVLERDRVGAACSAGNAGWITPSLSMPVPSPELRAISLRWLLRPGSPLYIKPSALPRLAPWLWRFWRHCNQKSFEHGRQALAALGADIMDEFDELESEGLEFEQRRSGLLMVFTERSSMDAELKLLDKAGYGPLELLSRDELHAREPALAGHHIGAIHVLPERHLRPEKLCAQIAQRLRSSGVDIREDVEVRGLTFEGDRASGLETSGGTLHGDRFLIATGAEAARLGRLCGTKLPIQAGKGYSVTVDDPTTEIDTPIYLDEAKIGVAPFSGALRLAGTMEFSGVNLRLDRRRIAAFRRAAEREIPGVFEGGEVRDWVGMRPLTPDGLPVIGVLPKKDNVFIASGHQMVGLKLAPSTGRALSELIVDGASSVDLEPFAPGRFSR
ncbi:MAG: FAD-dependent oxidoreductase [bacterium]|nr:FAD-dependent oxidoreductase [bacterium]